MTWAVYTAIPLGAVFALVSFLYYFFNYRNFKLKKLLEFKREIFRLKRDFYFLNQKKILHDSEVDLFLEELKSCEMRNSEGGKVSIESVNNFYSKQKKYKELKKREEFFSSCKKRAEELLDDLDVLISKYLGNSLRMVEKYKREKNKKLGKKVDKKSEKTVKNTWKKELEELRIACEELKDNSHLLVHSFSSFEKECREKMLYAKVVFQDINS